MSDDFALFKEEVKSRVEITDVVGEFVDLKRRGGSFFGLCPFHHEKTPSFHVNPDGQFYHCFGCGKGGDVISFLMDISNMSFMEALEQLAERAGLPMPERSAPDPRKQAATDRVMAANLAAAEFFHRTLSSGHGQAGMDYLSGRGLSPETIRAFRLGYAPADTKGLLDFGRKKGVDTDAFIAAGILLRSSYGPGLYNRFGDRVIFPIIDQTARIIGFGGRLMEGEGAKYINSPETPVYHKSRVLYGLHQAKDEMRRSRTAIVVEGYMDVLAMHQAGITNVIAASGTAFTVEQARIIARLARRAILLFDGDPAGLSAAARGADNLLTTDLDIGVVVLPEGHDPDSYISAESADSLRHRLSSPVDIWEFKLSALADGAMSSDDKSRIAGEIADSISLITDDLKRGVYINDLSLQLRIDPNLMLKAVNGRIRKRQRRQRDEAGEPESGIGRTERELLAAIIKFPGLARLFLEESGTDVFRDTTARSILDDLYHRMVEGLDTTPSALMNSHETPHARSLIAECASMPFDETAAETLIADSLIRFRTRRVKEELSSIRERVLAEQDESRKKDLLNRQRHLTDELKRLMKNGAM